jgi:hypothetical protein
MRRMRRTRTASCAFAATPFNPSTSPLSPSHRTPLPRCIAAWCTRYGAVPLRVYRYKRSLSLSPLHSTHPSPSRRHLRGPSAAPTRHPHPRPAMRPALAAPVGCARGSLARSAALPPSSAPTRGFDPGARAAGGAPCAGASRPCSRAPLCAPGGVRAWPTSRLRSSYAHSLRVERAPQPSSPGLAQGLHLAGLSRYQRAGTRANSANRPSRLRASQPSPLPALVRRAVPRSRAAHLGGWANRRGLDGG